MDQECAPRSRRGWLAQRFGYGTIGLHLRDVAGDAVCLGGHQQLVKLVGIADIHPHHGRQLDNQEHEPHQRQADRKAEEKRAGRAGSRAVRHRGAPRSTCPACAAGASM